MVFSSPIFLFFFLPLVFVLYSIIPKQRAKNAVLLVFSLLFYGFGQPEYVLLLLLSILCNYLFGLALCGGRGGRRAWVTVAVIVNLSLLAAFKYMDFAAEIINGIFHTALPLPGITLPIGISFFTFQGMSYVIDVYREPEQGTKSFSKLALYISMFPQLIAGPIIKYSDVSGQLDSRQSTPQKTAFGIRRFIVGMSKKLLIADAMAVLADRAFSMDAGQLSLPFAWLGAVCYCLQIYFDFSGYSDMAIGLGKMFGFDFKENFNYPYASGSMKEFWRRWHISLSSWFRDYLYIPLGGNRKGKARECLNKLIVFMLTGLWHGASWNFVLWGLWHGCWVTGETLLGTGLTKLRSRRSGKLLWRVLTLLAVILGFVVFRADDLPAAWTMLSSMFGGAVSTAESSLALTQTLTPLNLCILILAIPASAGLLPWIVERLRARPSGVWHSFKTASYVSSVLLLILCVMNMATSDFSPFIYFRF